MGSIRFFLTPKMSPNSWPTNKNDQLSHNCTKTSYSAASALDSPNISTHYMKTVDTFMTRVPYHWPVCAGGRSYLLPHFLAPPTRPNILSLIFFFFLPPFRQTEANPPSFSFYSRPNRRQRSVEDSAVDLSPFPGKRSSSSAAKLTSPFAVHFMFKWRRKEGKRRWRSCRKLPLLCSMRGMFLPPPPRS